MHAKLLTRTGTVVGMALGLLHKLEFGLAQIHMHDAFDIRRGATPTSKRSTNYDLDKTHPWCTQKRASIRV